MKKVGFLAVSLAALMSVGAARADIASTTYVTNAVAPKEATANKVKSTEALDTLKNSEDRYPSMAAANKLVQAAVDGAINKYATKTELATETNARTSADTALGTRIDNEASARTSGDEAIDAKIGKVAEGKTVVEMITEAAAGAGYDDAVVKADIKKNADAITTINNTDVMKSGATKAKIDAIATNTTNIGTNTAAITAIKTEQGTQNTKISALETGKQDKLGYIAEDSANKTITISAAASASDTKYPTEKAVATALEGKQAAGDYATNTALNGVKATAEAANNQANTNKTAIANLQTSKQDKLTTSNIKGTGSVTVTVADGVVTVDGTDTKYTLSAATANALGGVKSGGNITVATDGTVTVNQATNATNATKATQDGSGNIITSTYATKTENNAKLATATYNEQIGTVSATNMGTDATTVVAAIKEVAGEAAAAQTTANKGVADAAAAKTAADSKLPTTKYNTEIGTVSATNMGTTATTVVGGIKEAVTEAAAAQSTADTAKANAATAQTTADTAKANAATAQTTADTAKTNAATAQSRADSAYNLASAAIPKPSGDCKDCVLKFNGTTFSWEEIGR